MVRSRLINTYKVSSIKDNKDLLKIINLSLISIRLPFTSSVQCTVPTTTKKIKVLLVLLESIPKEFLNE